MINAELGQMENDTGFKDKVVPARSIAGASVADLRQPQYDEPPRRPDLCPLPAGFCLSIVMPVYNERTTLAEILRRVRAVPIAKEIILVDDGSSDGTRELLRELEADGDLQVVYQAVNRGKGAALKAGFLQARGDIVLVQDADLEYDPAEYPRLIEPILRGQADVVYGSRFLAGPARRVHSYWHTLANRVLTTLSNMFTDLGLTDMETCYKVFRGDVIRTIAPQLQQRRFGIEPELTARVAGGKYRVYEVDTTDVALAPIGVGHDADVVAVPESLLLNDDEIREDGIGPGDDVFLAGLFNFMRGSQRNTPIIRMGNVAMMPGPGELVPGVLVSPSPKRVVEAEAYLIEARSVGGISGSPAFVRKTVDCDIQVMQDGRPVGTARCFMPSDFRLLGLMNGHWEIDAEERNEPTPRKVSARDSDAVNMGIAVVIPAKKIKETLHHPELIAMRDKQDADWLAEFGTTEMDWPVI